MRHFWGFSSTVEVFFFFFGVSSLALIGISRQNLSDDASLDWVAKLDTLVTSNPTKQKRWKNGERRKKSEGGQIKTVMEYFLVVCSSQGSSFSWNQSNLTERLNGKGLLSKGFRPSSKLLLFLRLGKHCVISPKKCLKRDHIVWKLLKMSYLIFSILAFFTNFCLIKSDLSGNTV